MNVRQYIRPDIAASAIAHLSVLALVFVFTEVHPFGVVTAEPITVDIVRADEIGTKVEPDPQPQLRSSDVAAGSKEAQPAAQAAPAAEQAESVAPPPQQQPARQNRKEAALQQKEQEQKQQEQKQQAKPQAAQQPPQPPQPQVTQQPAQPQPQAEQQSPPPPPPPSQPVSSPSPGYTPPEPDITVKYHVMLGLPQDMPVTLPKSPGDKTSEKSGEGGDATASTKADVSSSIIDEFRRHLKTCSKLPDSVAATDKVRVKLRVVMTPQGRLAADPILMEASASAKGPLLMQSAVAALNACQPYTMLPANRYGEWKVIDLSFTPDDFSS
jgi:outer membrane biosynthesis protein TonB